METWFENLRPSDYEGKSHPTIDYNCIAWAAGRTDKPWWPAKFGGYSWPKKLPREKLGEETLVNFIRAFKRMGYKVCNNSSLEKGFEKVAIYVKGQQNPTHAARQLPSGIWTSKIGDEEDIEHHTLAALQGSSYGKVGAVLKRPMRKTR